MEDGNRAPSRTSRLTKVTLALTLAAGIVAVTTCIRIEVLNVRAGGVLPRHEYFNNDPAQGLVKWHTTSRKASESAWRKLAGPTDDTGQPVTRSLTPQETQQMNAYIQRDMTENDLRGVVASWGLLLYLIIPITAIGALHLLTTSKNPLSIRITGLAILLACIPCTILMIHRAYFPSLSW